MRCSAIPVRPPVFPPELDRLAEKMLKHSAHGDHAETSSDRRQIRAMRQTVSRGACHLDLFVQFWGKSAHSPKHLGANGGRERALIPKLSPSWRLRDGPQVVHVLRHTAAKLRRDAGASVEAVNAFLDHSSLAVTTVYLRRLEGETDRTWPDVAVAIGV